MACARQFKQLLASQWWCILVRSWQVMFKGHTNPNHVTHVFSFKYKWRWYCLYAISLCSDYVEHCATIHVNIKDVWQICEENHQKCSRFFGRVNTGLYTAMVSIFRTYQRLALNKLILNACLRDTNIIGHVIHECFHMLLKVAEERISNMRTVRSFAQEPLEEQAYAKQVEHVLQLSYKEALARALFWGSVRSTRLRALLEISKKHSLARSSGIGKKHSLARSSRDR